MEIDRSTAAPLVVVLVALVSGGWFLQRGTAQEQNVYVQVRLFQEVVNHVSESYVEEIGSKRLYRKAIDGLLDELGDPNTSFLEPSDWENLRIRTEGEYGGLGIRIEGRDGYVTVVAPIPGTPAARAGMRPGDRIVEVEGESAVEWSVDDAVDALRGPRGSKVKLKVGRPGVDEPIPFEIERARIEVHAVPYAMEVGDGVGYVKLQTFSESSTEEVRDAIDGLREDGVRGVILDLRSNPGGLLDQGASVSDLFLETEEEIVETRGRVESENRVFRAADAASYEGMPVVVLVDGFSASASEIVAGALQDQDRALVLGTTSFGKGTAQTLFQLSGGHVLKLTTARWYTPVGRSIQKPFDERRADLDRGGVLTLGGHVVARPDTGELETFTTDGGRTVYGDGGIVPDLIVLPDTLTDDEEVAVRALFREGRTFGDALFDFAVEYVRDHPDLARGFPITDDIRDAFFRKLSEAGLEADEGTLREARRYVDYQLAAEIARQKWGAEEEFRRTMSYDRQLSRAIGLLERADSPTALFDLTGDEVGTHTGSRSDGGE